MYFVAYTIDSDGLNGLFQELEDDPVYDQDEEPESQEHKGKTDYFQNRTHNHIQKPEDDPAGYIELPTACCQYSGLGHAIVWEKISDSEKYSGICQNGNEDLHKANEMR